MDLLKNVAILSVTCKSVGLAYYIREYRVDHNVVIVQMAGLFSGSMLKYFSRYGEVIDCVVMKNPATGKSRGFGFVTFKDPSCVETVLANGPHILDGRQVRSDLIIPGPVLSALKLIKCASQDLHINEQSSFIWLLFSYLAYGQHKT